ncbi:hypothetical protein [Desulfovibrio inopinatus]|uniref:RCC1 domain-containing protein n=1 Tax=Desulfovibrio inopinatus TaxID=102109 RepID=UPI000424D967|nr:hypothetical protein [Desulfovibrio inopinatus]
MFLLSHRVCIHISFFLLLITTATSSFAATYTLTEVWSRPGLARPESALYDPESNFIYVSNINGEAWTSTANGGFISRLTTDGNVDTREWAGTSQEDSPLHAPKGMAIYDGTLYVADRDSLVAISISTGQILNSYNAASTSHLNDVTVTSGGYVYVSDTANGNIYKLDQGRLTTWYGGLTGPNGLCTRYSTLLVGLSGEGILAIDIATKEHFTILDTTHVVDGLAPGPNNDLFFSQGRSISLVLDQKNAEDLVTLNPGLFPADISFAASLGSSGYILSPDLNDTVTAYALTKPTPTPPLNPEGPTVSAGGDHNLLLSNGQLYAFGSNLHRQVGAPASENAVYAPWRVGSASNWKAVSAGGNHSLLLDNEGKLYAYGWNAFGQTGNNAFGGDISSPTQVGNLSGWSRIAAGSQHSLAIRNGALYAFGWNEFGELGTYEYGFYTNRNAPTLVSAGTGNPWVYVAAGYLHSLGIRENGDLYAWGDNSQGELGIGNTPDRSVGPTLVKEAGPWKTACAGAYFSMAIKEDGTLWGFGSNENGRLGLGAGTGKSSTPVQVGTETNWTDISCGDWFTLALKSDGSLYGFGYNLHGELGLDDTIDRYVPERIGSEGAFQSMSAGENHSLAKAKSGTIYGCGDNAMGQLGVGDTSVIESWTLLPVSLPSTSSAALLPVLITLLNES